MERNKIYNLDCMDGMKEIPDKSVDLVVTDPPYWHKKNQAPIYSRDMDWDVKSRYAKSQLYLADEYMIGEMSDFGKEKIDCFLDAVCPKMKKMNVYCFCSETQVPYYCLWAERNGYMFTILVWEKPLSIISKNRYSQNAEFIVRVYEAGTGLNSLDASEYYNRVKHCKPVSGVQKHHPTEKPLGIMRELILLSSNQGDLVLDPFLGSGTTAVAAIREKRDFIGFELNGKYCKVAQSRIDMEQQQLSLFD